MTDKSTRFDDLRWADAKLHGLTARPGEDTRKGDIICDVSFPERWEPLGPWIPARLIFTNCLAVRVELDFVSMSLTGNNVADASCMPDSKLRTELLSSYEPQWLASNVEADRSTILHYLIELTQGGRIDVLATGFRVES
jgi:hypothetical protein